MVNDEKHILLNSLEIAQLTLRKNADVLLRFIDDDYVGIDPTGALIDKEILLGYFRSTDFTLTEHSVTDIAISVVGDVAFETGVMRLRGELAAHRFDGDYRYSHLWLRHPQQWRVRASQLTPILP